MKRLSLALVVVAVAGACASSTKTNRAPTPDEPHVTVATYNVNYGLAGDGETLDAVAAGEPDVICLQETTEEWEALLRARYAADYPHMAFVHDRGAGGLAVLSRYPIEDRGTTPSAVGWFPGWRVAVESPLGELELMLVHLRPPISESGSMVSGYLESDEVHEREMLQHLEPVTELEPGQPATPMIVLGDFNESASGGGLAVLEQRGFVNALEQFDPGADTWRWTTSIGQVTHQLDHVAYRGDLEPVSARVIDVGRSDHLPVVVTFTAK